VQHNLAWKGAVCEIGSGNSKLLYNLEQANKLTTGLGVEVSPSRHAFAEKFRHYLDSQKVTNLNKDVFTLSPLKEFDLVIAVDVVLQLISPLFEQAENNVLNWMLESLKPGGRVLLELWDFEHIQNQLELSTGSLQVWEEFPATDPYEFCLAKIFQNDHRDIIWEKRFVKRDSGDKSEFTNILRPYSQKSITEKLSEVGFIDIQVFSNWNEKDEYVQGEYIMLAKKE
jgi:SAM-dependent methyltransferase